MIKKNKLLRNHDAGYVDWKGWGGRFGHLSEKDIFYFMSELKFLSRIDIQVADVLEIGFGGGSFLEFGRRQGWRMVGTEVNALQITDARERGFDVFARPDLRNATDQSFDLIVAFDVLEHLDKDELLEVFSEIERLLRRGGVFVCRFPNGDSPLGLRNQNGDLTHKSFLGSSVLRYLAMNVGMEVLTVRGQYEPLRGGGVLRGIYVFFVSVTRSIIDMILNFLFSPRSAVAYCSANLVAIIRKPLN